MKNIVHRYRQILAGMTDPRNVALFLGFIGCLSIISQTYLGIHGDHTYRQADVLSHILGFYGWKGIQPLTNFLGDRSLYDFPIYSYLVGKSAFISSADPLVVVRFWNMLFWMMLAFFGYKTCEHLSKNSGHYFLFSIVTLPVFLKYYSVPLPDVMAISLCMCAVYLLLTKRDDLLYFSLAGLCLIISTLIKSPISYIFIIFIVLHIALEQGYRVLTARRWVVLLALNVIAALGAEQIRISYLGARGRVNFLLQSDWYFSWKNDPGLSADRILAIYPLSATGTYICILGVIVFLTNPSTHAKKFAPIIVAFVAGWITFFNLYWQHEYYQMPMMVLVFIGIAVLLSQTSILMKWAAFVRLFIIIAAPLSIIAYKPPVRFNSPMTSNNQWHAMSYLLRNHDEVLLVDSLRESGIPIGGLLKTRIRWISPTEFDSNCHRFIGENRAILVLHTSSQCLELMKTNFKTLVPGKNFLLAVR